MQPAPDLAVDVTAERAGNGNHARRALLDFPAPPPRPLPSPAAPQGGRLRGAEQDRHDECRHHGEPAGHRGLAQPAGAGERGGAGCRQAMQGAGNGLARGGAVCPTALFADTRRGRARATAAVPRCAAAVRCARPAGGVLRARPGAGAEAVWQGGAGPGVQAQHRGAAQVGARAGRPVAGGACCNLFSLFFNHVDAAQGSSAAACRHACSTQCEMSHKPSPSCRPLAVHRGAVAAAKSLEQAEAGAHAHDSCKACADEKEAGSGDGHHHHHHGETRRLEKQ